LAALRAHKAIALLLVVLGAAAGMAYTLQTQRIYTAEVRLAVAGESLTAQAVPGFALASQELAANYARYVNNAEAQASLDEDLGIEIGSVREVTASPIPESNVIRIEVTARGEAIAVRAASQIADSLMERVNAPDGRQADADAALAEFTRLSADVAQAEQASLAADDALNNALGRASSGSPRPGDDIPALRNAAAAAAAQLSVLEVQQQAVGQRYQTLVDEVDNAARLAPALPATSRGDDRLVAAQRFVLLGLAFGTVLATLVAIALERRRAGSSTGSASAPARPADRGGASGPGVTTGDGEPATLPGTSAASDPASKAGKQRSAGPRESVSAESRAGAHDRGN
jgi:hypothetical protein